MAVSPVGPIASISMPREISEASEDPGRQQRPHHPRPQAAAHDAVVISPAARALAAGQPMELQLSAAQLRALTFPKREPDELEELENREERAARDLHSDAVRRATRQAPVSPVGILAALAAAAKSVTGSMTEGPVGAALKSAPRAADSSSNTEEDHGD